VDNIALVMGICKKQVEEDIQLIENAMSQNIAAHTARINQEEKEDYMQQAWLRFHHIL
jgi:hypothetical protein